MQSRANLKTSVLMSVFFLSVACSIAGGSAIYVDDDATAGGNGESWENAFKYLQDALFYASSGDEIFVGEGTYRPDENSANPSGTGNRQAAFQLKNGVALRGGYAGFGQPDPDVRDPNTHETILSGDLLGNDGPDFANNGENSYHVVTGNGTNATAVVDGFTITGGNANGIGWENHGGGMFNFRSSPTLTSCTFSGNSADWAGGMRNIESRSTLTNCTFTKNSAEWGGGMGNSGGNLTVTNCAFIDNSAEFGGGMCNKQSNPTVTNSTFSDNSADNGGGMCNIESSPTLTNCTFIHNLASDFGGGMLNTGSSPTVTNCTFNDNRAAWGGGMENENNSNLSLIGCTIKANSVTMGGGAIRNHTSRPTVLNCLIVGNQAQFGGAIHNENSSSNPTLINCTISSNSANWGGGIINNNSRPILNNCILWANSDNGGVDESAQIDGGLPAVNYCCIQGWTGNLGGIGNINDDPWFVKPGYRNVHGVWIDGDYHLRRGSPCINAGDNSAVPPSVSKDLDGNPRIAGGTVDMGAYEDHSVPVTIYVQANASGENNGSSWANAFNDLQDALAEAQLGDEIRVARGAYSPEGPLPDIRQASNPHPVDGSLGVSTNADLSWTAGPDATSHDVYFGTTKPPPFMQNQTATTFDPGTMAYGTTYYWRIDELSNGSKTTGTIWNFMTLSSPPPPPLGSSNVEESVEPAADRTATFQLKNGVIIKGGYAGFYEPDPNARDIDVYETVLSGDIGIHGYKSDNSYHVVTGSGCNESAVLDGFTITAGNAHGLDPGRIGGGMLNDSGSPTVVNCMFSANSAVSGGGIYNWKGSNPTLANCTFSENSVNGFGGGMFNNSSNPILINCLFSKNSAGQDGGGILNHSTSKPILTNCTFNENTARLDGGGIANMSYCSSVLTNCILWGNQDGGNVAESAQIHADDGSTLVVNYCCIQGWTGDLGGTGNIGADPCFVEPEYFDPVSYWKFDEAGGKTVYDSVGQNHGTVHGGAQRTTGQINEALNFDGLNDYVGVPDDYSLDLGTHDLSFAFWFKTNNSAIEQMLTKRSTATGPSNRVWDGYGTALFEDGTVAVWFRHSASSDSGVIVSSTASYNDGNWHHLAGIYTRSANLELYVDGVPEGTPGDISYAENKDIDLTQPLAIGCRVVYGRNNDLYFNGSIDDVKIFDRALSSEEIQQDYLNGLNGQSYPDVNTPDYHLLVGSPCINAGDPDYVAEPNETDLDGKPRIIGGRIDMGAYEFNHIPVADAGPDRNVEAQAHWGANVTLDGSGSSDADSTPGTNDDTAYFDWYKVDPCDPNVDVLLGSGQIIDCNLSMGEHIIVLEVIDRAGASDTSEVTIIVQDTTPPEFELSVSPTILWPPDHKMVEITASWTVSDECDETPDVSLVGILANEGDDIIGDGHTSNDIQIGEDGSISLRAERSGIGIDRIYTITYKAVDDYGNTTVRSATVSIPHDFRMLARIAARWLWAGPAGRIPEDLNGDGIVNLADVARFAGNWTK